ncbi:hypothetical protein GJ496_007381 [Pomphorhynchus laevis]|nr:hypothetical protein GJ496_007381 [Pomphorhynchus laevis]
MFRQDYRYLKSYYRNIGNSSFQLSKTMSIEENVILKIEFNQDIRKMITKRINFAELISLANQYFAIDMKSNWYIIKYLDEENDWITVTNDSDLNTAFTLLSEKNNSYGIICKKLQIKIIKVEKLSETNDQKAPHQTSFTIARSTPSDSFSNKPIDFLTNPTSFGTDELTNKLIDTNLQNDIFGGYPKIEKSQSMYQPNLSAINNEQSTFPRAENSTPATTYYPFASGSSIANSSHSYTSQPQMSSNPAVNFQPPPPINMNKTQDAQRHFGNTINPPSSINPWSSMPGTNQSYNSELFGSSAFNPLSSPIKQAQPSEYLTQAPFVPSSSSIQSNQPFLFSSGYNPSMSQPPLPTSSQMGSRPSSNFGGFMINSNRPGTPQRQM